MKILVTGGAGFIGSAVARSLIDSGHDVTVVDNFNDYYEVSLKHDRVKEFLNGAKVIEADIRDRDKIGELFEQNRFDVVCNLAAMAGVRYSVEHPDIYVDVNINGLVNILEAMREHGCLRMVSASSSSVYGNSSDSPYKENMVADRPESVYGATKRAGELLLYSYFTLYGIQATSFRFFTVYGPWSRPDMAMLKFAKRISKGETIDVYNNGKLRRDFTYIDDIVSGFVLAVEKPVGYEVVNLGRGEPVELMDYIKKLEENLGLKAKMNLLPMQPGDVYETFADTTKAQELFGYEPTVRVDEGIERFVEWYRYYYS
ncbi:SDR family NAD(P)-dependent oxidoreductase [Candidatus Kaiserbacteria bacterium]|nr:SDR family NAD(P)-dependent oxidoreductase [Candidatus Kaiserbacteria bacterium]